MNNRWLHTILGLMLGVVTPVFLGAVIGLLQGIHMRSFIWNVWHRIPFYNSFYQLGIAINIGIFFLMMKKEKSIFFGRGWLVATIISVLWTLMTELNGL